MTKCNSPPRSANQEQVTKPKLARKVMTQKNNPKSIEGRTLTLFKKGGELATLCNAQVAVLVYGSNGSVQTWPNNSTTVKDIVLKYKQGGIRRKLYDRSLKSMEHKVADATAEGLDDHRGFELGDEEFEKLSEESKEQNLDETIKLIEGFSEPIEGSKSVDHPDNNSNCNPPIELAENVWDDLMFEDFDELANSIRPWPACDRGIETNTSNTLVYPDTNPNSPNCIGTSTISNTNSGNEQLGLLQANGDIENYSSNICDIWSNSLDYQSIYDPYFSTGIGANSSSTLDELGHDQWGILQANGDCSTSFSSGSDEFWIENNVSLGDFDRWLNNEKMTGLEEHQSCASAAGTSGYSSPTYYQSGIWTDQFGLEAAANNISNVLDDHEQQGMVAPKPSPLEEVLMTALQPKQLDKTHELIVID